MGDFDFTELSILRGRVRELERKLQCHQSRVAEDSCDCVVCADIRAKARARVTGGWSCRPGSHARNPDGTCVYCRDGAA